MHREQRGANHLLRAGAIERLSGSARSQENGRRQVEMGVLSGPVGLSREPIDGGGQGGVVDKSLIG
jgi:hypothetical protein